jgi:hypothetical protein
MLSGVSNGRNHTLLPVTVINRAFHMFSPITNIYNKKTKEPTLKKLFRATGKLKTFFRQLEIFDVWTTGDTAHIDTIFKFLPTTTSHHYHVTSLT